MNTRSKRYRRWPCELDEPTIEQVREYAHEYGTSNLEMTRRLIKHGLSCPFFLGDVSSERKLPPTDPTGK